MFYLNRIPQWIKTFPLELDRLALTQLAKSSKGPFEKSREMNFSLYGFHAGSDLEGAIHQLENAGWKCNIQNQADEPDKNVLTATKKDYILTESTYRQDTIFFKRIADIYNGQYDGWFASN